MDVERQAGVSQLEKRILDLAQSFSTASDESEGPYTKRFSSSVDYSKWKSIAFQAARKLGTEFRYEIDLDEQGYCLRIVEPPQPRQLEELLRAMQPDLDRWVHESMAAAARHHADHLRADRERARRHLSLVGQEQENSSALTGEYLEQALALYDLEQEQSANVENSNVVDLDLGK